MTSDQPQASADATPSIHASQRTTGALAARHAAALLAKDAAELEKVYDGWAEEYDADLDGIAGDGQWGCTASKIVVKLCSPKDMPKLLDFGCGTGIAGPHLKEHGWIDTLHGCDLSQGMLDVSAKRRCYAQLIKSTENESGVKAGSYDIVHSAGMFAPGQAPPSALDSMAKALRVGGLAIFTIRCVYYDGPEGAAHKGRLEAMCKEGLWSVVQQTEEEYLPKDQVTAYVFVMKKL
mmetsp:Transcript_1982/g.5478  ORF Transcript_1982/g.5478 Transcript_1982/m.5478 type:complete len:235 (-) Transcript_1982:370-1074(-)